MTDKEEEARRIFEQVHAQGCVTVRVRANGQERRLCVDAYRRYRDFPVLSQERLQHGYVLSDEAALRSFLLLELVKEEGSHMEPQQDAAHVTIQVCYSCGHILETRILRSNVVDYSENPDGTYHAVYQKTCLDCYLAERQGGKVSDTEEDV